MTKMNRYSMVYAEMNSLYHALAKQLGLSESALTILYILRLFDDHLPLKDLIAYTGMPKQTVHSSLTKMIRDGHVRMETAAKKKTVALTEAGIDFCRPTIDRIVTYETAFLESLPEDEYNTALHFTQAYMAGLRNEFRIDQT